MLIKNTIGVVALIAAALVLFGCKDKAETEEPVAVVEEYQSPIDSSVVDEIWYFFNGDVQKNLQMANTTFTSQDYESMIKGVEKAEAIMKLEGLRASGQNKADLDKSIKQMQKLADDARNQVFVPVPEYEQIFGNAQFVLGKFHLDKAREMWGEKDYFTTGKELYEATLNIENAFLWVDHKIDSTSTNVLNMSQKTASELIDDEGWVPNDVMKAFGSMDTEVNRLRGEIAT